MNRALTYLVTVLSAGSLCACAGSPDTGGMSRPDGRPTSAAWEAAASQPLPPGVARVTVRRHEVSREQRQTIEGAVDYRGDNVDVSAGALGGRNGLVIRAGGSDLNATLRAGREQSVSRSSSSQFLLLNEGSRGSLALLRSEPRPWLIVIPVYRGGVVIRTIREEVTGTGMVVEVEQVGPDAVTVQLMPYFHRARAGDTLVLDELATTVTLRPGQPYVIMQDRSQSKSVASALLSRTSSQTSRQVIAELRVDVGAP